MNIKIIYATEFGSSSTTMKIEELASWIKRYNFKILSIEEQQQRSYSEEDMIKFVSFVGRNYIKAKGFYYMKGDFEKSMKVSIHQIIEQFKKK